MAAGASLRVSSLRLQEEGMPAVKPIPDGYRAVAPSLIIADCAASTVGKQP